MSRVSPTGDRGLGKPGTWAENLWQGAAVGAGLE